MIIRRGIVANRRTSLTALKDYSPFYPGELIYLTSNSELPSVKDVVLISTDGGEGKKTLPVNRPIITDTIINLSSSSQESILSGLFCYSIAEKKFYILGRPSMILPLTSETSVSPGTIIDGGMF